jgi:hypothetical protein
MQLTTIGDCPWKAIYREVWRRGYVYVSSDREPPMPDGKYINAQWCAEEATALVMKLQNEGKGDRELLRAVALLATAIIKLAKKEG